MSEHKHHTPSSIREPFGHYVQGVEVAAGARYLFTSGQLGISKDDAIPSSTTEQATICFENIKAILKEAEMDFTNVIRINAYVTDRSYFKDYMAVRDSYVSTPPPASTLVIVNGFTREEFNVEIEVTAAKMTK